MSVGIDIPIGVSILSLIKMREVQMPFKKITKGKNKGKYKSPSGRVMTKAQVRAYYARKKNG